MSQKTKELIMQLRTLEEFYGHVGIATDNIKKIFKLTLGYLEGKVSKLEVKSFFDVLMKNNKLMSAKELDLLICLDNLIEENDVDCDSEEIKFPSHKNGFRNAA